MEATVFEYNGNKVTFQLGNGDVMVNATEMAKAFGKRPNDYLSLPSVTELIQAITRKNGIDENQLVMTQRGGNTAGTWLHEDIALDFAQWLSVDFKLWCNDRLKELLKGGFTATESKIEEIIANPDLVISLATELKKERQEKARLQYVSEQQSKELQLQAPKVQYYEEVLTSESTYTTTLIAKELGMSAVELNRRLYEAGVQYKQHGTWVLYSRYQGKSYTKTSTFTYTNTLGHTESRMQTEWTEAGRKFIHELIKEKATG